MGGLVVIVPSRGRPDNIRRLRHAWKTTQAAARLVVCVDDDDPARHRYAQDLAGAEWTLGPRLGLAGTLNAHAAQEADRCRYIGFMGDDHLPVTDSWDHRIVEALAELGTGIVYGNDLFQGQRLPTAVFMTSDIVRALGYICPPGFRHLYLDNVWLSWGRSLDRIRYLPDVIIEHVHPQAGGKAEWDAGYQEVNGPAMWQADTAAWDAYQHGLLQEDIIKLRRVARARDHAL